MNIGKNNLHVLNIDILIQFILYRPSMNPHDKGEACFVSREWSKWEQISKIYFAIYIKTNKQHWPPYNLLNIPPANCSITENWPGQN